VTLVLVLIGGAAGAVARYLTDRAIQSRVDAVFPWGTLVVNVTGSFILGMLSGFVASAGGLPNWIRALAGVGFCGALTTYSTFGLETVRLAGAGAWRHASINVVATLGAGIGACWLGWFVSS
jgi:fluoride exporter